MRHLPYEERLQRLGLHSLQQRRRLQADLITAFKIFTGLLDIDPNLFFPLPARRGLRGHPYKVLEGARHRWMKGSAFSVRVVEYWNKLPASVVTAPSVNIFKERLEKVWTEVFPHLTHWLNTHLPFSLPLHPTCAPSNSYLYYYIYNNLCYPTPCSISVVSSGPLWPSFYHYKSKSIYVLGAIQEHTTSAASYLLFWLTQNRHDSLRASFRQIWRISSQYGLANCDHGWTVIDYWFLLIRVTGLRGVCVVFARRIQMIWPKGVGRALVFGKLRLSVMCSKRSILTGIQEDTQLHRRLSES